MFTQQHCSFTNNRYTDWCIISVPMIISINKKQRSPVQPFLTVLGILFQNYNSTIPYSPFPRKKSKLRDIIIIKYFVYNNICSYLLEHFIQNCFTLTFYYFFFLLLFFAKPCLKQFFSVYISK